MINCLIIVVLLITAGCHDANEKENKSDLIFERYKNTEVRLTVVSSFGHFTIYSPPVPNQTVVFTIKDLLKDENDLVFKQDVNPERGYLPKIRKYNIVSSREKYGVVDMRFVSISNNVKVLIDIELFTGKRNVRDPHEEYHDVRAWIIVEVDDRLTQGVAGLKGDILNKDR